VPKDLVTRAQKQNDLAAKLLQIDLEARAEFVVAHGGQVRIARALEANMFLRRINHSIGGGLAA
jgi:hypothetical protein